MGTVTGAPTFRQWQRARGLGHPEPMATISVRIGVHLGAATAALSLLGATAMRMAAALETAQHRARRLAEVGAWEPELAWWALHGLLRTTYPAAPWWPHPPREHCWCDHPADHLCPRCGAEGPCSWITVDGWTQVGVCVLEPEAGIQHHRR